MAFNLLRISAISAIILLTPLTGGRAQSPDQSRIFVGITPVELEMPAPTSTVRAAPLSEVIARTVNELLPIYVQRGLERGLDRRVSATSITSTDVDSGPEGQQLSAIVALKIVSKPSLGVIVSARVIARPSRSEAEETLLLSPTTNFGELDDKMSEFALRIAKRFAELNANNPPPGKQDLPRGIVRFYCVLPAETGDRKLQLLARRLTVELPFYLTMASFQENLDLFVLGLDFKDALSTCEQTRSNEGGNISEAKIEGFSWYGTLASDGKGSKGVQLSINSRNALAGGNTRRVSQIAIKDVVSPDFAQIAESIMKDFLAQYVVKR